MVVFPNAKINIGLDILEKRPDGFHNLSSCFYPITLSDSLEVVKSAETSFRTYGMAIPGEGDNLCIRAYHILSADYQLEPVSIHLLKGIPIGAGLGGGSSDAAFTIQALDSLFGLRLETAQMEYYAGQLGSDCPFFIRNRPMYCFGKGDQFEDIELSVKSKHVLLVNPNIHISTAEAYAGVTPSFPRSDLRDLLKEPVGRWEGTVKNDFEVSLFPKYPLLSRIKSTLYGAGAVYAAMSGSGSTMYGIFDEEPGIPESFGSYFVWKGVL